MLEKLEKFIAKSIEIVPRCRPPLKMVRIHLHTAQKKGSGPPLEFVEDTVRQKRGPPLEFINQRGSASSFHQLDGGPPLKFINKQPQNSGSASSSSTSA